LIDTKEPIHAKLLGETPTNQDKVSDRAILTVATDEEINPAQVVDKFNSLLTKYRADTYSLALSSFREHGRKRLAFEEALHLINHVIETM